MADDVVEAEVAEESVEETPEPAVTPEEPTSDTDAVTEETPEPESDGGEPTDTTESEPEPSITFDDIGSLPQKDRMAWIREHSPELAQDLEYAGAERREAKLRQEAGTKEAAQARLKWIKSQLAEVPDGNDDALNFLDDNNRARADHDWLTQFTAEWNTMFTPTAEERATIEAAALSGDTGTYARTVFETGGLSFGLAKVLNTSVVDLAGDHPDSTFAKTFRAEQERVATSSAKADEKEANAPVNGSAPPTPEGAPVGSSVNEDPASSWAAASRAYNEGKIDGKRYQELATKFEVPLR